MSQTDDRPPWKDWRQRVASVGPDFAQLPAAWWGHRDWEQVEARSRPLNQTLPPAPPERTLPAGFTLHPDRQRPPTTKGERAVQEIRSKLPPPVFWNRTCALTPHGRFGVTHEDRGHASEPVQ